MTEEDPYHAALQRKIALEAKTVGYVSAVPQSGASSSSPTSSRREMLREAMSAHPNAARSTESVAERQARTDADSQVFTDALRGTVFFTDAEVAAARQRAFTSLLQRRIRETENSLVGNFFDTNNW